MIYQSITELVGKTPLVELKNIEKAYNLKAKLFAKLEYFNPTGSAKDRPALEMILDAKERGELKDGGVIIEATSGNTGIGLASMGTALGYKTIIVMPDTMSKERIKLMKAYGAEVVLSDGRGGMAACCEKAKELKEQYPDAFEAKQFENKDNWKAHYKTTGPEIWSDLNGKVDAFVAGVGTGGTITGTSKYLKEQNSDVFVLAVEPQKSPVLRGGVAGGHGLQGIGANFIPKVLDTTIYDDVCDETEENAYECTRTLGKLEGIMCGISSGAALHAAITLGQKDSFENKNIVVLLPDSGDRYLSTTLFGD